MEFMRSLFAQFCDGEEEAEARALLAYSLFIGSYFVAIGRHGARGRGKVQRLAIERLLE